ncbi:protein NRT1/ PTR FAMILY 4.4-like isoform X2 [Zingiber officinale]|uniref:protein NRT1/ PTR FAMILY 4.4-like isoform X2 n=1 Tax=Zingiber officinale TaxID=94328 RepID=UPI001C4B1002|nr:protein NRT1/ PTR FAMILY 4.4-like isoform X2 [Zingiber officinale]
MVVHELPPSSAGYGLLALQAHLPSLHPPHCNINDQGENCQKVHGWNSFLLYVGLYMLALGDGCVRVSSPSLGGDQFDGEDPVEVIERTSFFNSYAFGISLGGLIGLVLLVWIQNNKGWDIGFGVSALSVLLSVLVVASGFSCYRNQIPEGSPIARTLQVLVAAFRKRNASLPENPEDLHKTPQKGTNEVEVLSHTHGFKFLDKAAIVGEHGSDNGPWSLCTVTQVEETKVVLGMIPIIISSILGSIPNGLVVSLTVQQGTTMDTRLGKIRISPANLFIIPQFFQTVMLVVYDRSIVPILRRMTGYTGGITHLQRVAIGFLFAAFATCAAAVVENRRMKIVEENGLQDMTTGVPMSVFWLVVQFCCLGVVDVTSFVGLLEFFNSEAPRGMKSIGTAISWCVFGLAAFLGSITVELANKASRHGTSGRGWIEGNNLNKSHLDYFYWLLCSMQILALLNFIYWARRYTYRQNLHIQEGNLQSQSREIGSDISP